MTAKTIYVNGEDMKIYSDLAQFGREYDGKLKIRQGPWPITIAGLDVQSLPRAFDGVWRTLQSMSQETRNRTYIEIILE